MSGTTNVPFSEITLLWNHLKSCYAFLRIKKASLKYPTYKFQMSHLILASLHTAILCGYKIQISFVFLLALKRGEKGGWMCRIGRRMEKGCHFGKLNTDKLYTTNVCNINHILRHQKSCKLQHPQNLQIAAWVTDDKVGRRGREGELAIFKIETGVDKELSRRFHSDPRVHVDVVFLSMLSYNEIILSYFVYR